VSARAVLAVAAVACVTLAVLVGLSIAQAAGSRSTVAWRKHHEEIRSLPDELYHHDRFRGIRGRVTDEDGKPVSRALVQCVKVESLVELAKSGGTSLAKWTVPIEAHTATDDDGAYDFPSLPVGSRTFFYSARGRDLAPAVRDLVVVQDGLGASLDVTLKKPSVLRVRLGWLPAGGVARLHLVPHRWWPALPSVAVPNGATSVEFRSLGGPFERGLIVASRSDGSAALRVVGRYDLQRTTEVALVRPAAAASRLDMPEAAGFEPWQTPLTSSVRLFYAAISPVALFWPTPGDLGPLSPSLTDYLRALTEPAGFGTVRGFAPHPFLPVLVKSPRGVDLLTWANEASEFEIGGLPAGPYRARALDLFGRVTFASGAYAGPERETSEATRLWAKLDLAEPDSREVMGFVRWESGVPAEKAVVFMQNTYNFRKFVRRVETDAHGYFRFSNVPGNEPYFVFALPPGQTSPLRNFDNFAVAAIQREVWRDQVVHPHRVTGSLPEGMSPESLLQLVRMDSKRDVIVWSFRADPSGRFTVENVPHGHYRVHVVSGKTIRSSPLDVVDGRSEVGVRWTQP